MVGVAILAPAFIYAVDMISGYSVAVVGVIASIAVDRLVLPTTLAP
jgi:hypothetical protein